MPGVGVVDDCYRLAEMWGYAAAYPIPGALHVGGIDEKNVCREDIPLEQRSVQGIFEREMKK
jgi:hypothetical protein